jgi:hypothetical protein
MVNAPTGLGWKFKRSFILNMQNMQNAYNPKPSHMPVSAY